MPTTFANSINGNEILAKRAECDYGGNDIQQTYATKSEVTTGLGSKEDSANKAQTLDPSSSTEFPSSSATANYVNSSVATATANFLGNFTLTDLGLTYPATDAQIGTALDSYAWPVGTTPTNNDYVYVEIQDPQTTGIDDRVERFKFNGSNWLYEYTLNNSSFTVAEKAAIDSGINSTKVTTYDTHVADTTIHVTSTDKSTWNAKQDAISDLATIRSGAALGATAVQPGDLATVATSGSYNDLSDKPSIPAAQVNSDWNASSGVAEILNKPQLSTVATTGDYADLINKPSIPAAQVNSDWNAVSGVSEILNKPSIPTATSDLTNDSGFITLSDVPAQVNADWNAVSGAAEILNKPTIPSGSDLVPPYTLPTDEGKVLTVGPSTTYWSTPAVGSVTDVEVDGVSVVSQGVASITMPTVDQTYNSASTNAQSGTAVAGAISGINQVPASTSSDEGKVLTVDANGDPEWNTATAPQVQSDWAESDPTATSYIENKPEPKTLTAGTGISITEDSSTITVALATIGTWEDVSTEAQYNTTPVLAGGFAIKYNSVLKLVSVTADVQLDAGAANIFTWSNRLKPVANAFALGNGLTLYVSQTSLNQSAAATTRWVNGVWMWPVVG